MQLTADEDPSRGEIHLRRRSRPANGSRRPATWLRLPWILVLRQMSHDTCGDIVERETSDASWGHGSGLLMNERAH
jgi:hypothetical protein